MAKAKPNPLVKSLSGKIGKNDGFSFRLRYGKQEIYNPQQKEKRAPMTAPQERSAAAFGNNCTLASRINKDPQASAEFRAAYLQLDPDKRPQILYRYILSSLNSNPELAARYQHLLLE